MIPLSIFHPGPWMTPREVRKGCVLIKRATPVYLIHLSETSYIFKHVEEHGRAETSDKWSIRQIGVYHRGSQSKAQNMIIFNPSTSLQKQLKRLLNLRGKPSSWNLHRAILSSSATKWRWFINDVESRYIDMVINFLERLLVICEAKSNSRKRKPN